MPTMQTRRQFLVTASMAGGAILLGAPPAPAAEGTLETTTVRLPRYPGICVIFSLVLSGRSVIQSGVRAASGGVIEAYSAALSSRVEPTTPNPHHRSMRFLRLVVDERLAAAAGRLTEQVPWDAEDRERRRSSAWVSESASTKISTVSSLA
jgi:hypothetical protein